MKKKYKVLTKFYNSIWGNNNFIIMTGFINLSFCEENVEFYGSTIKCYVYVTVLLSTLLVYNLSIVRC